ncbi:hypothetical protein [Pseudochrobactrum asaccharolyticum]|uniref:Uncharacterized protein n=1 Tax=Pseudochrobactrum asaccharolyticum TaxID=354351 RepID=A0A366EBX3_9HYPH|nr:hypothetical protein [Pseudochrobactrum asaccharolyticum]RBO98928.1 hypothetical protein DFR47_101532 [Pseudochrobactrum asaccharolyticum]
MKLTQINLLIDIPELNRFNIGDKVVTEASERFNQTEGIVVGIELRQLNSSDIAIPNITLLDNEGSLKSGFKPADLRLFGIPTPRPGKGLH